MHARTFGFLVLEFEIRNQTKMIELFIIICTGIYTHIHTLAYTRAHMKMHKHTYICKDTIHTHAHMSAPWTPAPSN